MRFPDRSPVLDKNLAPMGPEILSSTGAGAWRKASVAFPDSSSVLDKFQSAINSACSDERQQSRLSFPATDPLGFRRVSEGFQKGFLQGSLKGFRRGSEGF